MTARHGREDGGLLRKRSAPLLVDTLGTVEVVALEVARSRSSRAGSSRASSSRAREVEL